MNARRKRIFWDISEGNITEYRRRLSKTCDEVSAKQKVDGLSITLSPITKHYPSKRIFCVISARK